MEKTTLMSNTKLAYITFLQSFGIFLVVLGHSYPAMIGVYSPLWMKIMNKVIYSFHMPLFFAISGFLFAYTYKENYLKFIHKKIIRILIPFFGLGIFGFLMKYFFFNSFAESKSTNFLTAFLYPAQGFVSAFWFLQALFLMFMIAPAIFYINKLNKKYMFITLFLATLAYCFIKVPDNDMLSMFGAIHNFIFFLFGIVLYDYREKFEKNFNIKFLLIFISGFLGLLILSRYYQPTAFLSLMISTLGILFSFNLSYICSIYSKNFLFGWIDGYSYQIYLIHSFIHLPVRILYKVNMVNYNTDFVLLLILGLFIPIVITNIINRFIPRLKIFIGL